MALVGSLSGSSGITEITGSLIPSALTNDLGSSTNRWGTVHSNNITGSIRNTSGGQSFIASGPNTSVNYNVSGQWEITGTAPTAIQSDGWYGHGIDGDLITVGDLTLTRDTFYNNLTIAAGHNLKPAGWRLYVAGTLSIAATATINDDGNSATTSTGATGLVARGGIGAAAGGGGNGSTGGTNGVAGAAVTNSTVNASFVLPNGGAGGNGGGNTGGAGGINIVYNANVSLNTVWPCLTLGHVFGRGSSSNLYNGGAGGGGGGAGAASTAGGGGSGGGGAAVHAKTIDNGGRISANGGSGANASLGNAGGGGGGGGGYVVVIYQATTGSGLGTVQAIGGSGGAPSGTGVSGIAGVAGIARTLRMG